MLTVKARLKGGTVTFIDRAGVSDRKEYEVIITFLDRDATLFEDYSEREMLQVVFAKQFNLTEYEIGILKLARQGLTNDEIAGKLEIGVGSVRNQLSGIFKRLGVRNRTGAVAKLNEYGVLD